MKKILLIFLSGYILCACAVTRGTYDAPLIPMSTISSDDIDNATVIFYRSDSMASTFDKGDRIIIIDRDDNKTYYEPSEIMITNENGYTIAKLSPGIHTFSFFNQVRGMQTALLNAGEIYYLALTYSWSPITGILSPIINLNFTEEDVFFKNTNDKSLFIITKGFDRSTSTYEYEVVE